MKNCRGINSTEGGESCAFPPVYGDVVKSSAAPKNRNNDVDGNCRHNKNGGPSIDGISPPNDESPDPLFHIEHNDDTSTGASTNKMDEGDGSHNVPFTAMFKYADRVDIFLMVFGGCCAFVGGAGLPGFAEIFGQLLQKLSENPPNVDDLMAELALVMVYIGLATFLLCSLQVFCWMLAGQRQVARIRLRFFEAVLRQDIAWHDRHKPGELTARMDADMRVLQNGINDRFSSGLFQLGVFLFGFGFAFYRSWELTLVLIGTLPFIAFVAATTSRVMTRMTEASREHYALAGEIATEVLENVKTVQVFGREEYEVAKYTAASAPSQLAGIKRSFARSASQGFDYWVVFCSYGIAFYFASYLIEWGRNTVGETTATFFAAQLASSAIGRMLPSITAFNEARAAAGKVFSTIERVPSIDIDDVGGIILCASKTEIKGTTLSSSSFCKDISFKNVSFAYPTRPDFQLFKGISFTIQKGSVVAFSGTSGCGKSSLTQLLQRFYDPDGGSIAVDGTDLRDLNLLWWRDQIGIVSQEPSLFSGTIADNIRVGKPDATMEQIMCACKRANMHDFIMTHLPDKYSTLVGSAGSQLSGGQKQRLAIARAIVKNPAILILDEATSALDRKSEIEVQAALDGIIEAGGLTVIVIAHRLATIRNVDTIYFVVHDDKKGSWIAESGTYDELLSLPTGEFAKMSVGQDVSTSTSSSSSSCNKNPTEEDHSPTSHHTEIRLDTSSIRDDSLPIQRDKAAFRGDLSAYDVNDGDKSPTTQLDAKTANVALPHLRVFKWLLPDIWSVILGLLGSVITGGLYPAGTIVFANMLDVLGKYAHDPSELRSRSTLWAGLFGAVAMMGLIGWALQGFFGVAGERLTQRLRESLLRAILRHDAGFFDMPGHDAGVLSGVLSGDCEAVHQLVGPSLGLKIQLIGSIGIGLIVALFFQWKVALVTSAGIPVIALAAAGRQKLITGFNHQTTKGDNGGGISSSVDSIKSETLTNIRTVTSFNMKRHQVATYKALCDAMRFSAFKDSLVMGLVFGFSQFAFFGVFALGYWYGGKLMAAGEAEFLDVVIASTSVLLGAMGAGEAGSFASMLKDAEIASKRVFYLLDHKSNTPSSTDTTYTPCNIGEGEFKIEFDSVTFRYPARPDVKILRGLTTAFENHSSNGLMGQTGCGKSTIIQVLARFYEYEGSIKINNADLSSIDMDKWRRSISVVLQEPSLFSGSVLDNIKYSRGDATDEEVFEVARIAAIHDDILLMPNGYDTDVGYKGRSLSGGQKQRIAIARGLLRNPRLLLLDEATSALDNATESRVQFNIETMLKAHPMTVISVAHRLTTIRFSDKIILMDNGVVVEEGSHDELMTKEGGVYRERWEMYSVHPT